MDNDAATQNIETAPDPAAVNAACHGNRCRIVRCADPAAGIFGAAMVSKH